MYRLFDFGVAVKKPSTWAAASCLVAIACLAVAALAQSPPAVPKAQTPLPTATAKAAPAASKPGWSDLNATQQQSLKPLAASWSGISEAQKRKWLEVSKNYSKLSAADQAKMHSRMVEWVGMSPQDRAAARLNFAKTKELSKDFSADEKKAKWETYQSLTAQEKANLAAKATPKPVGAATAIKPVPVQKLAATPKNLPSSAKPPAAAPISAAGESALGIAPAPAN